MSENIMKYIAGMLENNDDGITVSRAVVDIRFNQCGAVVGIRVPECVGYDLLTQGNGRNSDYSALLLIVDKHRLKEIINIENKNKTTNQ